MRFIRRGIRKGGIDMDDKLKPDYVFIGDGKGKVTRVDLPIKDITEDVKPNPYHIGEHLGDGDMELLKDSYDAVGYIPPITLFYKDYAMRIEEKVLSAVSEIGVDIDKERLIKILEGDRKSYDDGYRKGFADGQKSAFDKMYNFCFMEGNNGE